MPRSKPARGPTAPKAASLGLVPSERRPNWEWSFGNETSVTYQSIEERYGDKYERAKFQLSWNPVDPADMTFVLDWTTERDLADEDYGAAWRLAGGLRRDDRGFTITHLEVSPRKLGEPNDRGAGLVPLGGVTSTTLRYLPLGVVHEALAHIATSDPMNEYLGLDDMVGDPEAATSMSELKKIRGAPARSVTGRPRRSDEDLRDFAETFLRFNGSHADVAAHLDDMPPDTVKTWIRAARQESWLAPGVAGRRGSPMPGPRLIQARLEDD